MKTNKVFVLTIFFSFCLFVTSLTAAIPAYKVVTTGELKKMLDDNIEMTVIDARNPEEYQEVHIKGAINIPVKEFVRYQEKLPKDKTAKIIFYCNGIKCGKSKKAAQKAIDLGYTNISVYADGIPVWEEKGMPIYTGPDYEKRIETTIITSQDLQALINSGTDTYTVVDVRDPDEFADGHIQNSINIPVASFASQSEVLDKKRRIIVYCNSGGRSYNAYRKLMKLGYKEINQAIFADWKDAGMPVIH